jgi:glycosyltransferase involved in cell wall biosynthesis
LQSARDTLDGSPNEIARVYGLPFTIHPVETEEVARRMLVSENLMVPKVSICIPAYQQPQVLRKTLRSIAEQTFRSYEIVITDDSSDASVQEVAKEFAGILPIDYHRNPRRLGSPENWNEAVRRSHGDYVKILHHDDWFHDASSLGCFVALLDRSPHAALGFGFTLVHDVARNHDWINAPAEQIVNAIRRSPAELFFGNHIGAPSATIFRRNDFEPFDRNLKWLVDVEFYIRLLQKKPDLVCCPKPLICTTHGANHQVTYECQGNKDIEAYEWLYLYLLLDRRPWPSIRRLRRLSVWLRQMGVHSPQQLKLYVKGLPLPGALRAWMRIREFLWRTGIKRP